MATPTFSAKLPDVALSQLDELSKLFGINKTQVVIRAISDLYRRELPNMNTQPYFVDEQMLGQFATEQDARHMVTLLQERGYDVEYGTQINKVKPVPDDVWFECLTEVQNFMQLSDDTSNR